MAEQQPEGSLLRIDPESGPEPTHRRNERRITSIESLVHAVLFVAVISMVGIVVAVVGLVIDELHFNNQTYRQQSEKTQLEIEYLKQQLSQAAPTPSPK
ncbi:hypothetical protein IPG36_00815 [bacterium]|nr:MAG: hypothetical protein IPG36_00815 [bacterium]